MMGFTIFLILIIPKFLFSSNFTKENYCQDRPGGCSFFFDRVDSKFCVVAFLEGKILLKDFEIYGSGGKDLMYYHDDYIYKFKIYMDEYVFEKKEYKNKRSVAPRMKITSCERTFMNDIQIKWGF